MLAFCSTIASFVAIVSVPGNTNARIEILVCARRRGGRRGRRRRIVGSPNGLKLVVPRLLPHHVFQVLGTLQHVHRVNCGSLSGFLGLFLQDHPAALCLFFALLFHVRVPHVAGHPSPQLPDGGIATGERVFFQAETDAMLGKIQLVSFVVFQLGNAEQDKGSQFRPVLAADLGHSEGVIKQDLHPRNVSEVPLTDGPRDIELGQPVLAAGSEQSVRRPRQGLGTPKENFPCLLEFSQRHFKRGVLAVGLGDLCAGSAAGFRKYASGLSHVVELCVVEGPVQRNLVVPRECGRGAFVHAIRTIVGSVSTLQSRPVAKDAKKLVSRSIFRNGFQQAFLAGIGICPFAFFVVAVVVLLQ
mmetsp:Transcript_7455/g.21745  ORF Transcript_7455/g.21745 Transcript_7455/m.21745 type:complete len:357 (+) Transcript_7455:254-1324(+)